MTARIRRWAFGTALILAPACGRAEREAAGGASTVTVLDHAVAVTHAIRATPTATDSILAAHGLTRAEFNDLMYEVAADSALALAYTNATQ
jgi:hypothetical protein